MLIDSSGDHYGTLHLVDGITKFIRVVLKSQFLERYFYLVEFKEHVLKGERRMMISLMCLL